MEIARVHVVIYGIVQGVFFRASTREEARALGLTGWVKNCFDGNVEAVIEGDRGKVEQMLKWCKIGPPGAKVENIKSNWETSTGEFDTFSIKY
ncbi:MAG: acylphosphatase [Candidatus Brocadiaceae bacterium]|nr:acylphosphatase [Candidatus Brocadiaceae bacterium]